MYGVNNHPMIMIEVFSDGSGDFDRWQVDLQIQDGVERVGTYCTFAEAIRAGLKDDQFMNGNGDDRPFLEILKKSLSELSYNQIRRLVNATEQNTIVRDDNGNLLITVCDDNGWPIEATAVPFDISTLDQTLKDDGDKSNPHNRIIEL